MLENFRSQLLNKESTLKLTARQLQQSEHLKVKWTKKMGENFI